MGITAPDQWASTNLRGPGVRAWHESVPDDIKAMIRDAERVSVTGLVAWFRSEVAAEYPDAKWPGDATPAKVEALLKVLHADA